VAFPGRKGTGVVGTQLACCTLSILLINYTLDNQQMLLETVTLESIRN
jgi:hypothetical protein